eukprot:TRINITY_DN1812_c0_g1_i1.p1 TRINITY_DN1812_c0_g1~~TRINITY_DN1812_c0_g1_i1.p1  ORF type:complete len:409 (-),score=102.26 TRINITY_DN1812_c0_g1_i1:654-1847(-)
MGCASSTGAGGAVDGNQKNAVDKLLEAEAEKEKFIYKVLLLGAGESGKSTFSKQLRLIYKQAISAREREASATALRFNVLESMGVLLEAMHQQLEIPLADSALAPAAQRVLMQRDGCLTVELAQDVQALWQDEGVQAAWAQRGKFHILDASPYYFREAVRIADPAFEITEEDLIMSRSTTTGVKVATLPEPPFEFSVVDVGGQRNERKKWIHIFDDVKAVVFVVSLVGYSQVMFEDPTKNRMHESLELFEQIVSNPLFEGVHIFLLLNKKDLFEQAIQHVSLKTCFPEYEGEDGNVMAAIEFVENKFRGVMAQATPGKPLTTHCMAARVRMECRQGWNDIVQGIKGEKGGKGTLSPFSKHSPQPGLLGSPNKVTASSPGMRKADESRAALVTAQPAE